MNRKALYRSWRPQRFADVIGQPHIVHTFCNALQTQRLAHAYLFSGPRGTGKTSIAKLVAKAINCQDTTSPEPCNQCEACVSITAGASMDVIELDAASHRGIDEIRDMRDKVKYAPSEVRCKVYIIDEVHMLTTEAFNALLKTLEEPPPYVLFLLATTEPHKVPATIHSRCQRFDFRRITIEEQVERLRYICDAEGIAAESMALSLIARLSEGGMRDALSMLDQAHAFSSGAVSEETVVRMTGGLGFARMIDLFDACAQGNVATVLRATTTMIEEGRRADACLENVLAHARTLLHTKLLAAHEGALEGRLPEEREQLQRQAEHWTSEQLFAMMEYVQHMMQEMKYATQPRIILEVALLKIGTFAQNGDRKPTDKHASVELDAEWREAIQAVREQCRRLEQRLDERGQPPAGVEREKEVRAGSSSSLRKEGERSGQPKGKATRPAMPPLALKQQFPFVAGQHPFLHTILQQWPIILTHIKQEKIIVHAWLKDGEPVAYHEGRLLLAFKSAIHRETTEREEHRQLIERVLAGCVHERIELRTCMWVDWQALEEEARVAPEVAVSSSVEQQPIWVVRAKEQFGEHNVVIEET